jgi:hypothetical protein
LQGWRAMRRRAATIERRVVRASDERSGFASILPIRATGGAVLSGIKDARFLRRIPHFVNGGVQQKRGSCRTTSCGRREKCHACVVCLNSAATKIAPLASSGDVDGELPANIGRFRDFRRGGLGFSGSVRRTAPHGRFENSRLVTLIRREPDSCTGGVTERRHGRNLALLRSHGRAESTRSATRPHPRDSHGWGQRHFPDRSLRDAGRNTARAAMRRRRRGLGRNFESIARPHTMTPPIGASAFLD